MALNDEERRRACKALWGWSLMDQPKFAEAAGVSHNRLRTMLDEGKKSPPSTDELIKLAKAAGVPESFAIEGFGESAEERIRLLEATTKELAEAGRRSAGLLVQHGQDIQALLDWRRRAEPGADSGR